MQQTDDKLTMFNTMATLAKPTSSQPRICACSSKCKKGRNAEEDSQIPRVAACPYVRKLWAESVDRLLREDPEGLPYEPASSKEILPFPDLGDEKERLKELADKTKASGKTPINYFTGDMPLYTAAGAVTRPPSGCSPTKRLEFFQDHMWNLPATPMRPLLGDSAAKIPSTAAIGCPASGKSMALTDQEAQGSTLSGLCRSTHGLGSAALLPQTVARLAPASAETGRAAAAALMAAAPPASDRPIVLLKTMAPACIIHKAQGSTLSGLCRSTHSPGAAALTPQTVASLDVRAGPLPLSLPSPPEPAQAIDRTSAPDATLALLHPAQNPSSAPEGRQWWTSVRSWAQDSCLRFIHAMQKVMKKAASPHLGRSMLTALQIQPATTALEHAPGPLTPVRRHGGRSAAGLRVAGIIRRDVFTIMALIGDRSVSHVIVGAIRCQLERGDTRSAHLALARFLVTQGRRMALISSACLHSMAAANSHMPAWPAPALAARPGRLPLLLWTLTLDRPLVTYTELYRLDTQLAAEQDTAHPDPPATDPPPGAATAAKAVCLGLAAAESASAPVAGKRGARAFRALLPTAYRLAGAAAGAVDCIRHLLHSGC